MIGARALDQAAPVLNGFQEIPGPNPHFLILPICILEPEGGMREYMRAWLEDHRAHGRPVVGLEPNEPGIAWANQKRMLYFLALFAQVYGFRTTARLITARFQRLFRSLDPADVVQVTTFATANDVFVRSILLATERALVINTLHDPVMHLELRSRRRKPFYQRVLRNCWSMSVQNPRYFIHLHNPALLTGVDYPREAKIIYHEHPVPPRRATRKRCDSELWIGVLGRIEQYKGLGVFAQALRLLQSACPEVAGSARIVISGTGHLDRNLLEGLKFQTTLENRFLSDQEFHQRMADLDVLVLPYTEATQSGVGAMGLAYGVRIVASNAGGIPNLLNAYRRARLVPSNDPQALAAGLLQAIEETFDERRCGCPNAAPNIACARQA